MRLKITQAGLDNYEGFLQCIPFKNGLSLRDVTPVEAIRISVVMACQWENGAEVSREIDNSQVSSDYSPVTKQVYVKSEVVGGNDAEHPTFLYHDEEKPKDVEYKTKVEVLPPAEEVPEVIVRYTREELEAIADEKGINGLRDIATPLGLKGTSIRMLLDKIYDIAGKE